MDRLAHNSLLKIIEGQNFYLYRVILDEPILDKTALVRFQDRSDDDAENRSRGGRRKMAETRGHRKKKPLPNMACIEWFDRTDLDSLFQKRLAMPIKLELEHQYFSLPKDGRRLAEFRESCRLAAPLLNYSHFREEVLAAQGFNTLYKEIMALGCSKPRAYKIISLLCRFGFSERSLMDRRFACGAKGERRFCEKGGRKKPGRKPPKSALALKLSAPLPVEQPGMSSDWFHRIMTADGQISPSEKICMKMPERIDRILESNFATAYRLVDGSPVKADFEKGSYPNRRQIWRILTTEISKIDRIREKTTKGHFKRSLRGLTGKMFHNIPGPGHSWAIDSTIGNILLRSTLNRSWIVGRPVVYIVVDVWSTAVVGFHVCIQPPSWAVAKIALFNSVAGPDLLGELFGCSVTITLNPLPTLPACLWMDNGEYKSLAARAFGINVWDEAFTPPYRPDWHGVVEVLHRITSDMTQTLPGSINYRRQELELRKYRPRESVMTLPEFVQYLFSCFTVYNLTADRKHRLDATMAAVGVQGTPAGLWRFGHAVGIGTSRSFSQSELIADFLPNERARVTKQGIYAGGLGYGWPRGLEEEWSTIARNSGGWEIQSRYHPSSVAKIWTPDASPQGMVDLTLPDTAMCPRNATVFDYVDVKQFNNLNNDEVEHQRNLIRVEETEKRRHMKESATRLTREADATDHGPKPTITETRQMEMDRSQITPPPSPKQDVLPDYEENAMNDNMNILSRWLESLNREVGDE